MPVVLARGSATRTANMAQRRERILAAARDMISSDGYPTLNLRALAERAAVTVPTIYNLIGNKEALVSSLFDASLSPYENLHYVCGEGDLIEAFESFYDRVIEMLAADPSYHRAEYRMREHLKASGEPIARQVEARIESIAIEAATQAREAGLLLGDISSRQLGQQLNRAFSSAYQEWANGSIDLDMFKNQVMTATCLCYAADAAPATRMPLLERLEQLNQSRPRSRTRRKPE